MLECIVIIVNTVRILHPVIHEMVRLTTGRTPVVGLFNFIGEPMKLNSMRSSRNCNLLLRNTARARRVCVQTLICMQEKRKRQRLWRIKYGQQNRIKTREEVY